ncbi:hypothetical protein B0H16DRAFT_1703100 [Mycena metata]|uniref:Uncharacterized protein n=1 Tax=Mycena metata TaxID=1033252 RepID=A0AAD7H545_9AGAR|nr:hypothetical protein B0H16DRAFT_1703100 [Mycena metata]
MPIRVPPSALSHQIRRGVLSGKVEGGNAPTHRQTRRRRAGKSKVDVLHSIEGLEKQTPSRQKKGVAPRAGEMGCVFRVVAPPMRGGMSGAVEAEDGLSWVARVDKNRQREPYGMDYTLASDRRRGMNGAKGKPRAKQEMARVRVLLVPLPLPILRRFGGAYFIPNSFPAFLRFELGRANPTIPRATRMRRRTRTVRSLGGGARGDEARMVWVVRAGKRGGAEWTGGAAEREGVGLYQTVVGGQDRITFVVPSKVVSLRENQERGESLPHPATDTYIQPGQCPFVGDHEHMSGIFKSRSTSMRNLRAKNKADSDPVPPVPSMAREKGSQPPTEEKQEEPIPSHHLMERDGAQTPTQQNQYLELFTLPTDAMLKACMQSVAQANKSVAQANNEIRALRRELQSLQGALTEIQKECNGKGVTADVIGFVWPLNPPPVFVEDDGCYKAISATQDDAKQTWCSTKYILRLRRIETPPAVNPNFQANDLGHPQDLKDLFSTPAPAPTPRDAAVTCIVEAVDIGAEERGQPVVEDTEAAQEEEGRVVAEEGECCIFTWNFLNSKPWPG